MLGYTLRRIAQAALVLVGVTLITFVLEHLLPGSIARSVLGVHANPVTIAAFNRQNDLNASVVTQYLHFLGQLVQGNLGYDYQQNRTVNSIVTSELPRDLVLGGLSLLFALVIAIPVGLAQAVKRNTAIDRVGTGVAFTLYSMPPYVPALIGIDIFAIRLHWLPTEAPQAASALGMLSDPTALILPVATLTLVSYAMFSRYMRSSAVDTLLQPFLQTARAKGLPEAQVVRRHVIRNSLIPVVTLVGLSLPGILTAGLIVEQIFNFPGIGLQYYQAASSNDFPTLIGITLIVGVVTVLGNLLADLGYAALDPRVRL